MNRSQGLAGSLREGSQVGGDGGIGQMTDAGLGAETDAVESLASIKSATSSVLKDDAGTYPIRTYKHAPIGLGGVR